MASGPYANATGSANGDPYGNHQQMQRVTEQQQRERDTEVTRVKFKRIRQIIPPIIPSSGPPTEDSLSSTVTFTQPHILLMCYNRQSTYYAKSPIYQKKLSYST